MVGDIVELVRAPGAGEINRIVPEDDLPRAVHSGPDLDHGRRPEGVVEELVFPAPGDLDGLPRELRQHRCLDGLRVQILAAEPSPDEGRDNPNIPGRKAQRLGDLVLGPEGRLRRGPDRGLVPLDLGRRRVGLDCGVGHVAVEIGLVEERGRERLALFEVAALGDNPGLGRDRKQVLEDRLVIEVGFRDVVFGLD